jgi:hypothetical protein
LPAQIGPAEIRRAIGRGALEFEHVVEAVLAQLEMQAIDVHRQVYRIARLRVRDTEAQQLVGRQAVAAAAECDARRRVAAQLGPRVVSDGVAHSHLPGQGLVGAMPASNA